MAKHRRHRARSRSARSSTSRCSGCGPERRAGGLRRRDRQADRGQAGHRRRQDQVGRDGVGEPRAVHPGRQGRHRRGDLHDQRRPQGVVDFAGPYFVAGQAIMVKEDNTDINGPDDLAGKTVCSVEGSTPAENIEENYPDVKLELTDALQQLPRAAAQRPGRRRHHGQRHPRRLRRPERGRLQARRGAVHRGAVRHRPEEGRHGLPHLHQRRARGVVRGRLLGGRLGGHAGEVLETPEPPTVDRY